MKKESDEPDLRTAVSLPMLPEGENELRAAIVGRGRKALGALFNAYLDRIAALEDGAFDAEYSETLPSPTQRRLLSFDGFRKGVDGLGGRNFRDKDALWELLRPAIAERLAARAETILSDDEDEINSCPEFSITDFTRRFVGRDSGKELPRRTLIFLIRSWGRGSAELRSLIPHNMGLIYSLVRRWPSLGQADQECAVSEGVIGLRIGILRFEHVRGNKLSTFTNNWVKQAVGRYVANHGRNVRIPVHVLEKRKAVRRAEAELLEEVRRKGGRGEYASVEAIAKKLDYKAARVLQILQATRPEGSLDAPLRADGTDVDTFLDMQHDESPLQDEEAAAADLAEKIRAFIATELTTKEARIIRLRFFEEMTLEQVGELYGLTRERIRQIQTQALKKIKRHLTDDGITSA